jgi:uncharacterized membrane protein YecN with MAPEG domain
MDTLHGSPDVGTEATTADPREQARKRLQERRDFTSHLAAFVVVNAFLILVWALTGGYFWPAWVLGVWGAGLVLHAWEIFLHRPITDADVDAELNRLP